MKVKMILPALTEAISPYFRPIKYSLFPPLGLATLAGYLHEDDQVTIQDEHVEKLDLNDDPELVVIQVYITSAYRAWDLYDTRHVVYHPAKLTPEMLEAGYWRAYRDFYRWGQFFKEPGPKKDGAIACSMWHMLQDGRNLSRRGTLSLRRNELPACYQC